jgi:hypothetical protein
MEVNKKGTVVRRQEERKKILMNICSKAAFNWPPVAQTCNPTYVGN